MTLFIAIQLVTDTMKVSVNQMVGWAIFNTGADSFRPIGGF